MKYIVISIGNSDNKLEQTEWSMFVADVQIAVLSFEDVRIHFFGGASNWDAWQNVAWIIQPRQKDINLILAKVAEVREKYRQESAFVMVADGLFI